MSINTNVKFYSSFMPRAPQITGVDTDNATYTSFRNVLKTCLVTGFGEVSVLEGSIENGICTFTVNEGDSFSDLSTVLITGVVTPIELNGEFKVEKQSKTQFSVRTEASDGFVQGSNIKVKYAAAGWLAPFDDDPEYLVVRQNPLYSNGYYLQIREPDYRYMELIAYHSMEDINDGNTPVPNPANYSSYIMNKSTNNDIEEKAWFLVANRTTLYFFIKPYSTATNMSYGFGYLAFGDFIWELNPSINHKHNTIFMAAESTARATRMYSQEGFGMNRMTPSNGAMVMKNLDWGDPAFVGTFAYSAPNLSNASGNCGPTPPDVRHGGLNILPYYIINNVKQAIGRMKGVYFLFNNFNGKLPQAQVLSDYNTNKKFLALYTNSGSSGSNHYLTTVLGSIASSLGAPLIDITGPWE